MAQKTLTTRIKLKYDLEQNWFNSTTILMAGETGYVVDSLTNPTWVKAKIGNGVSLFKDLPYLTNLTEQESTDFITSVIDSYNQANKFVLYCGGAEDDFDVPPFLTDEVLESAVNDSLDAMLTRKF